MRLSANHINKIVPQTGLTVPDPALLSLPEKVLQFGTGVLLRGLPDYFIDKANRQGLFNGRIVVVKSTGGDTDEFGQQDNLFTHCVRGIEQGQPVQETIINSSISRVISAQQDWKSVLDTADSPAMQLIISNTTEVGIMLVPEDRITNDPPVSFPGKLLAYLYERYKAFKGSPDGGMVIVPTELITDNGEKLKEIVKQLADINKLEAGFIDWLNNANYFCNSLVDRIVPGKLSGNDRYDTEKKLGYTDELMILSESFRLWAIETDSGKVKEILSFSKADEGVAIESDIEKFRELKLRLLNGSHTFSCGLAHLAGFTTVREAMGNEYMSNCIYTLMMQEIAPAIVDDKLSYAEAAAFATTTLDRFRNPYLDHQWLSICLQYSSKMKMRNVPLVQKYFEKQKQPPPVMAMGFAAFLLFMKAARNDRNGYQGMINGKYYPINDDQAAWFDEKWKTHSPDTIVQAVLSDQEFWGADLSACEGFTEAVRNELFSIQKNGAMATLRRLQRNNVTV